MNIEEFREFCLSLPDVTEATPFEKFTRGRYTILVFYVCGRMFCYFNVDDFSSVTIKCDPAAAEELKARYAAVGDPFNGNKKHWISVRVDSDVDDPLFRELVKTSYRLVRAGGKSCRRGREDLR